MSDLKEIVADQSKSINKLCEALILAQQEMRSLTRKVENLQEELEDQRACTQRARNQVYELEQCLNKTREDLRVKSDQLKDAEQQVAELSKYCLPPEEYNKVIEEKMDEYMKELDDESAQTAGECSSRKIKAIKRYRQLTGSSLKASKIWVENRYF